MEILRALIEWTTGWATTPYGGVALFAILFISGFYAINLLAPRGACQKGTSSPSPDSDCTLTSIIEE